MGPLAYPGDAVHLARCGARLRSILRGLRPDVVITHLLNATVIGRVAASAARVPVRMAMVPSPLTLEAPLTRWLDRLTAPLDHAVIAGSEQIRDLYLGMGIPSARLERVYYGADAERFDRGKSAPERIRTELGVSSETKLIAQVAHFYAPWQGPVAPRLIRGRGLKGHETLLRAARIVRSRRPDTRFLLVGGARGSEAQRYRETVIHQAGTLGLADSVSFLGDRGDVPDILAAVDVAVQCSLAENLGGTIEALLMATPTVATRVGGMPEAVIDEQTGLLVPPDDAPALAAAILKLLDDPARAAALADAGRARMLSGFTLERTIADLDRIIRNRT